MKKTIKNISLMMLSLFVTAGCNKSSFDNNSEIKLYTRNTDSGTRDGFFTGIGLSVAKESNEPLKTTGLGIVESNGDMISAIKNDIYGIGYISMSSLASSNLKGLNYENVNPTEDNVLNGTYKLTRNFNYIVRESYDDTIKEEIVQAFIAYLKTQEGKSTMQSEGGILSLTKEDPTWDSIKTSFEVTSKDNSNIVLNFGGSTSVSKMAQALAKEFSSLCGNVKFYHDYHGSGDAYKKTQGADKDASLNYDIAFASRDFKLDSSEPAKEGTYGTLCIDAIVPVVNNANNISSVTANLLKDMYTGKINKWNEIK